ncbi:uncharacterized protein LOC141856619 [Brevipalpus obovatus]|uniref:uncharacterized protein LOC141856619 n=1 Tax=Brevipalpus obovatus TaxID=246614 RepID=UPI003D9DDDCA
MSSTNNTTNSPSAKEAAANQIIQGIGHQIREAYDAEYHRSIEGKIEIASIVFNVIAYFASIFMACHHCGSVNYFSVISGFAVWLTLTFFILHTFHIHERITVVPWTYLEFGFVGLWTVFYFISFIALVFQLPYIALAVMGLVGAALYGYQTKAIYPKFQRFREEQNAPTPNNQV